MVVSFCTKDEGHHTMSNLATNETTIQCLSHVKYSWCYTIGSFVLEYACSKYCKPNKGLYVLCQVRISGLEQKDPLKIYLSVIRPVLGYACPVWHAQLPKYLITLSVFKSGRSVHLPPVGCMKMFYTIFT